MLLVVTLGRKYLKYKTQESKTKKGIYFFYYDNLILVDGDQCFVPK